MTAIDPLVERDHHRRRRLDALERVSSRLLPGDYEEWDRRIKECVERDEDVLVPLYLQGCEAHELATFILDAERNFLQTSSTAAVAEARDRLARVTGKALLGIAKVVREVMGLPLDECFDTFRRLVDGLPIDAQEVAPPTRNERMELQALSQQKCERERLPFDRALVHDAGVGPLNHDVAIAAGTLGIRERVNALNRVGRVVRDVRVPVTLTAEEASIAHEALFDLEQTEGDAPVTEARREDRLVRRRAMAKLNGELLQAINRFMGQESPELAEELARIYAATPAPPEPVPAVPEPLDGLDDGEVAR